MSFPNYITGQSNYISRLSWGIRKKIFRIFIDSLAPHEKMTVLDIGVKTNAVSGELEANYFEKLYPYPSQITGVTVDSPEVLTQEFSHSKFIQGDGRALPFADQSFDIVFSSSVIEHVGSYEKQCQFIREACRVGKNVFITTPNRYFPIEVHCRLPFIHYFPLSVFWSFLKKMGFSELANENLLRPIGEREFKNTFGSLAIPQMHRVFLWGLPVYLIAVVKQVRHCEER